MNYTQIDLLARMEFENEKERLAYETDKFFDEMEYSNERKYYDELIKRFPNIIESKYDPDHQFYMAHDGDTVHISFRDPYFDKEHVKLSLGYILERSDEMFIFIQKELFDKVNPSVFWPLLTSEINLLWKNAKVITFGIENYFDYLDYPYYVEFSNMIRHYSFDNFGNICENERYPLSCAISSDAKKRWCWFDKVERNNDEYCFRLKKCGHKFMCDYDTYLNHRGNCPVCETCKQINLMREYKNRGYELLFDKGQVRCLKCERIYNREPKNYSRNFVCCCQRYNRMEFYDELFKRIPDVFKEYDDFSNHPVMNHGYYVIRDGVFVFINFVHEFSSRHEQLTTLDVCLKRDNMINIYIQKEVFDKADPLIFWPKLLTEINGFWKEDKIITFGIDKYFDYIHKHIDEMEDVMVRQHSFDEEGNYLYDDYLTDCIVTEEKPELKIADVGCGMKSVLY